MALINWIQYDEKVVGQNHASLADVVNRPLRELLDAIGVDPDSDITSLPVGSVDWSVVTSTPTTLSGYGITDAYTQAEVDTLLSGKANTSHTHDWSAIVSGKPTTLAGYGITDAYTDTEIDTILGGYYTDSEVDTLLGGKANTSHSHAASDITSGTIDTARLGSGTADNTVFLRGDQTWATPAGGSGGGGGSPGLRAITFWGRVGTTVFSAMGQMNISLTGTWSEQTPTNTNNFTRMLRCQPGTATSAGSRGGFQSAANHIYLSLGARLRTCIGDGSNINTGRFFAGFHVTSDPLFATDPSAMVNCIGFGYGAADSSGGNWQLFHNDASGAATQVDTGVARSATEFYIFEIATDDGTSYDVRMLNAVTGAELYSATISTNLPDASTLTRVVVSSRNEAAGGTAPIIGHASTVIEMGAPA